MPRRKPDLDHLPDDPALIAAMIERHLGAAQAAIRDLACELRPAPAKRPAEQTADLFGERVSAGEGV